MEKFRRKLDLKVIGVDASERIPEPPSRRHLARAQAQDHRRPVHRDLRARSAKRLGGARFPGPGDDLPRRHRERPRQGPVGDHQVPPQRRRPPERAPLQAHRAAPRAVQGRGPGPGRSSSASTGISSPSIRSRARPGGADRGRGRPRGLAILREADDILVEEVRRAGVYNKLWQAFAVLLPVRSVGVMGDQRTYQQVVVLRLVQSVDGMTANWFPAPRALLARISTRIVNEVQGVNRVVYDVTTKPPGNDRMGIRPWPYGSSISTTTRSTASWTAPSASPDLVDAAYRNKMPAVALTDHGNIFGAVEFFKEAKARASSPSWAARSTSPRGSRFDRKADERRNPPLPPGPPGQERTGLPEPLRSAHQGLLEGLLLPAADRQGASRRHTARADRPLGLPQGRGRLTSSASGRTRRPRRPRPRIRLHSSAQGQLLHRAPGPRTRAAEGRQSQAHRLARKLGLPLVATNDIHFSARRTPRATTSCSASRRTRKSATRTASGSARRSFISSPPRRWPSSSRKSPTPSRTRPTSPPSAISTFPRAAISCPSFEPPGGK